MDSIKTFIRRLERDAAVIDAVRHAVASMKLVPMGRIQSEATGLVIDLQDDIERLTGALLLLGNPRDE